MDPARQAILAESDLVITCGLNLSDVTTGGFALDFTGKKVIRLLPDYTQLTEDARTDPTVYYGAGLTDVLSGVLAAVAQQLSSRGRWWAAPEPTRPQQVYGPSSDVITEEFFFARLESFLRADDVLIAETGTSGQNTVGLHLPTPIRYINQSSWGSIGYALPALLGALAASPDRRHVLCTGDGSFQVTAQELSTIVRHGFTPIILLLNNSGYTIERAILGKTSPYNDIANWAYSDLPRVFGIDDSKYLRRVCSTPVELDAAFKVAADTDRLAFIEVKTEPLDIPPMTAAVGDFTRHFDYGAYGPENI
jgi:indolepyruvate decarboxylase